MTTKTIDDLQQQYGIERIPYFELLTCKEWRDKRELIINRDNKSCKKCGKQAPDDFVPKFTYWKDGQLRIFMAPIRYEIEEKDVDTYIESMDVSLSVPTIVVNEVELKEIVFLHVHHQYYVLTSLPWDYPDAALITVCSICHEAIHKSEVIPVYREVTMTEILNLTPCPRCYGQGVLPQYSYYQNGICFKCGGAKFIELRRNIDELPEVRTLVR